MLLPVLMSRGLCKNQHTLGKDWKVTPEQPCPAPKGSFGDLASLLTPPSFSRSVSLLPAWPPALSGIPKAAGVVQGALGSCKAKGSTEVALCVALCSVGPSMRE